MQITTKVQTQRYKRKGTKHTYKRLKYYEVEGHRRPTLANNFGIFTKYKYINITLSITLTFMISAISILFLLASIWISALIFRVIFLYVPV